MIGYDATNTIGQNISVREKIYLFTLSYFCFFYKSLPLFSFKFNSLDDLVSKLSDKIFLYFQAYVATTEASEEEKQNIKDKKQTSFSKKPLAKYYLAAIYYYEPTFDFENSNINQIQEFGEIYLKQLFQENILYFLENAKKYINAKEYSLDYDSKWKYFAYAMLRSQYDANFLNTIQQPVSYPSRQNVIIPNQPEVSFFSEIQGLLFEEIDEIPTDSSIVTFVGLHTNKDLTLENNVITKEYWDDAPNILRYFVKNTSDTPEVTNAYTSAGLNSSISDKGSFTTIYTQVLVKFGKTLLFDAYPPIKQPDAEKNELSTFFEFSFQPNYEKITTKFPALKDLINKKSFDTLINSYFLKLSKTETYIFMKNLLGGTDLLTGITEEEFSSLFDLQIALLYKMPKYLLQDANAFTTNFNYFDGTSFGTRSWYVDSGVWGSAASILYNPLIKPEENKLEKNSKYINIRKKYVLNRSLTLGNAFDDFGIVIRTFNPQQTFLNDTLLNKVITIIDEAKTEEAKIIKDEFVKNLDYNPFDFSRVAGDFLAIEAAQIPQNLVNENVALFSKPYSEFSKNLLDSLITNAEKVK